MEVQPARPAQTGPAKKPRSEPRPRNPEATQKRILKAAKAEFAKFGLGGARVDRIAQRATANKRMIYHYFGSKEDLFRAVLRKRIRISVLPKRSFGWRALSRKRQSRGWFRSLGTTT
jgi:AcrR family transcriptional regulator